MANYIGRVVFRQAISSLTPSWETVEGMLTYQIYGDEKTYFSTPIEIVCLVGLVASSVLMFLNFSLVYTGPSLMNACVVGACVVGLYACHRVRHLLSYQKELRARVKEMSDLATQTQSEAAELRKTAKELVDEIEKQKNNSEECSELEMISKKVDRIISVAREKQDLSSEIRQLTEVITEYLELARQAEACKTQAVANVKPCSDLEYKVEQQADTRLNKLTAQLRELVLETNGDVRKAVQNAGLKLLKSKENGSANILEVIQILKNDVLPKVQGDTYTKCQEIIENLEAL